MCVHGYLLDRLELVQGAVDLAAVADVAEGDVDRGALLAGVAFLEIGDGVDVVLMPDQHAALEGDVHEALSDG